MTVTDQTQPPPALPERSETRRLQGLAAGSPVELGGNGTPTFLQLLQLPLQRCQFVLIHPAKEEGLSSQAGGAGCLGGVIGGLQVRERESGCRGLK